MSLPAIAIRRKPPSRILVVCLRRIGDVLLATALIRRLRLAWPAARIEALVFAETAAVLAGNPDLDQVHALPARGPEWRRTLKPMFRSFDLALALQTSDRAHAVALWCGRHSVGLLPQSGEAGRAWKRLLIDTTATPRPDQHTVLRYLELARVLGLPAVADVVPPRPATLEALDRILGVGWALQRHAVVHPSPMFRYKAWPVENWRETIVWLRAQGLRVCISGGPAVAEKAYVAGLLAGLGESDAGIVNLCGRLKLAELTPLIESAAVFLGPDTSVTHLAAATGAATIALFGPSDPVVWGPWPASGAASGETSPWQRVAPLQQRDNVTIIQGTQGRFGACIPCRLEGCERRLSSPSDCLDQLPATRVIEVIANLLASRNSAQTEGGRAPS